MISIDDKKFCVLSSIGEGIKSSRLVCYMYIYQVSGLDINFKYKTGISSLKSEKFDGYLNYLFGEGYIDINRSYVTLTDTGDEALEGFVFSLDELEYLESIQKSLDNLTDDEVFFIVLSDILISEIKVKYGVDGLIKQKAKIETTLLQLSGMYSDEEFNAGIALLDKFKKGI